MKQIFGLKMDIFTEVEPVKKAEDSIDFSSHPRCPSPTSRGGTILISITVLQEYKSAIQSLTSELKIYADKATYFESLTKNLQSENFDLQSRLSSLERSFKHTQALLGGQIEYWKTETKKQKDSFDRKLRKKEAQRDLEDYKAQLERQSGLQTEALLEARLTRALNQNQELLTQLEKYKVLGTLNGSLLQNYKKLKKELK